jgi:selenocysteine lyase/cysteine desulfurase
MQRTFDVTAVREQFPALEREHNGRRVAYLDGPGGSQVASSAIDAVTRYMSRGSANLHGAFPTSVETEEILHEARRAGLASYNTGEEVEGFIGSLEQLVLH